MKKIIITNPKFIVERDGNDYVLKFRQGNIYKPIEFNNAQLSGRKNTVISQPNFSIIDDKLYVNINGHDVKIGEVGDGYTLASKLTRNTVVEPNLDVVITSNGGASVVTEIGGKNITINGGGPEPVYTNRIYYTVVEGRHKPESTWITNNCSENNFDSVTGDGYLVLNPGVTTIDCPAGEGEPNMFNDIGTDNNVTSVIIQSQIISIGENAFRDCRALTSVTIPNSVTSIGNKAFNSCNVLTSVNIPNSVTSIGNDTFRYCIGLTSVIIPNSVTSIGENAFCDCTGLISVTIPDSVINIGNSAFENCTSLTSVTLPNSITHIRYRTFAYSGLTSITIPNSVTSIESYVFKGCSGLTSITIPNSVTFIGENAFDGCSGLTSVTISNSVMQINNRTFISCRGLTSVTIPDSVMSISTKAFSGCTGLTSATIPNSVTQISNNAFENCTSLASVTCFAITPPSLGTNNFTVSGDTLYVPSESVQAYLDNTKWNTAFNGNIQAIQE